MVLKTNTKKYAMLPLVSHGKVEDGFAEAA
jgi:hypothetical protein